MLTSTLNTSESIVDIGYLPLLDSAPLIIAQEVGFFAEQGLTVNLVRENNWASIRDKLALGMLDAAHLLGPMVIASHLNPLTVESKKQFQTSVSLGYNGNAITFSNKLSSLFGNKHMTLSEKLLVLKSHVDSSAEPLALGTVHSHSMHTYLLHLLLKKADIDSSKVIIKVIPPIRMVEAMQEGSVDMFCVGEPWNTQAQIQQAGNIFCYGSELWPFAPEKVLAVNTKFAQEHAETHRKMVKAIIQACQWLEEPDHLSQSALWISSDKYLDCSSDLLIQAMIKQWHSPNRKQHLRKIFFSNFATAPWPEHADWIFKAMMASGQIPEDTKAPKNLKSAYDWTTYQEVMGELNLALPTDSDTPTDLPKI